MDDELFLKIYRRFVEVIWGGENDKKMGAEIRTMMDNEFGAEAMKEFNAELTNGGTIKLQSAEK